MALLRALRAVRTSTNKLQSPSPYSLPSPLNHLLTSSVRWMFLTADQEGLYEVPRPSPDAGTLSTQERQDLVSAREVARPLYRALLSTTKQLSQEFVRYRTTEILSKSDLAWLRDKAPEALSQLHALEQHLATEFRKPLPAEHSGDFEQTKKELSQRLDLAFSGLALVTNTLHRLQGHAVDTHSECLTSGIRVIVQSKYGGRDPRFGQLYSYKIKIRNEGRTEPVQLISRSWNVLDLEGRSAKVIGPGVTGLQPVLDSGEEFEYESFTPLQSSRGTMAGHFAMLNLQSQELFDVEVAPFALIQEHL